MPVVGAEDGVTVNGKDGGTWKSWSAFWAKDGGTWKKPLGVWVRRSGNWVKIWDEKPVLTITSRNYSYTYNGDGTYNNYYRSYFTVDTVNFATTITASRGTVSPSSVSVGNSASGATDVYVIITYGSPQNQGAWASITASNASGSVTRI